MREVRVLHEEFRLVTLAGEALRGVTWSPGQKLQVAMGGWAYRTYTPFSWEAREGSTQLLLFLHGDAPGSAWGRGLKEGDPCTLFGPRHSLDLESLERPAVLFGDETSFGLALALRETARGAGDVRLVFEVTSRPVAESVLGQLGLGFAELVERRPGDAHLDEVEALAADPASTRAVKSFALSGKASSIQRLHQRLRALGRSGREIRTRAYWAPGKVGLD